MTTRGVLVVESIMLTCGCTDRAGHPANECVAIMIASASPFAANRRVASIDATGCRS